MRFSGELQIETQDNLNGIPTQLKSVGQNRKFFGGETTPNVRKQRLMMLNLKGESESLRETLVKLNQQSHTTKMTTSSFVGFDNNSPMMRNKYEDLIDHEQQKLFEVEKNISAIQSTLKAQTGDINGGDGSGSLNMQIKMLENRLDQANKQFSEALTVNKGLRHTIDGLRKERVIFDNLYKKLEREIDERRKNMADLIESANEAFEDRDKTYDRVDSAKDRSRRKSVTDSDRSTPRPSSANNRLITKNEVILAIHEYERDFSKIQAATNIEDIEDFINLVKANEENNYNIFSQVNELSNEVDVLERAIKDLKNERRKIKNQPVKSEEEILKEMRALGRTLSKLEQQLEKYDVRNEESDHIMEFVFKCIETLYKLLDCEKVFTEKIGPEGVTEDNMMQLFNILEERADQIVSAYIRKKTVEESAKTPIEFIADSVVKKDKFEIPDFVDFSDEEGMDGDKPFTMEEFLAKATNIVDDKFSPMKKTKEDWKKNINY